MIVAMSVGKATLCMLQGSARFCPLTASSPTSRPAGAWSVSQAILCSLTVGSARRKPNCRTARYLTCQTQVNALSVCMGGIHQGANV